MTSTDDFLGGKIKLKQNDYKATSDAVLLAAAIPAKPEQTVLDVGCGNGAVALCVMARIPNLKMTAVDVQDEMLDLTKENAQLNGFEIEVQKLDVAKPPTDWKERQFHHVMTNPPYFTEAPKRANNITAKAHAEQIPLAQWLDFCIKKVRAKGTLTIIHRVEAVPEILSILNKRMGKIMLVPLYPKAGIKPKRVLIQATKNSNTPFALHSGFVLHNDDDTRTEQIDSVLRNGNALL